MINKHIFIVLLFVLVGVLFALSSCSEAGSETPKPPLDEHTLTYAPINGIENREITAVSPKWEPQLATAVSYTSADLPEGLTLDAQTGVITGKIPSVINAQTFTITATATGTYSGVVTATVSITITSSNLNTNSFSYSAIAVAAGTDILEAEGFAPTWTNTLASPGDVTYSISGDSLPDGLSINENGVIWGKPTTPVAKKTYTISATAKDGGVYSGNTTGTVSIIINAITLSEHSLSYPPIAVPVNIDIPEAEGFAPIWTDELAFPNDVRYTSTDLPAGLALNENTGVIWGTPTAITEAQDYTITATAKDATSVYAGEVSASVNIIVLHSYSLADYDFKYDSAEITAAMNSPVTISPKWSPKLELPDAVSYSIENADGSTPADLPTGLTFAETTGVISGEPTEAVPTQQYTITATGSAPYTDAPEVNISITTVAPNDISGYTLSYPIENKIEGVVDRSLSVTPSWDTTFTPATDISYEIDEASPPLPDGLTFAKTTGVISGEPTTAAAAQTYLITASGTGSYIGKKSVSVSITIFAANDIAGPDYSLSYLDTTTPVGSPVTIAATWTGLPDTATITYSVSPSLRSGLSFSTQTGAITGTPNTVFSETYTVTATAPPSGSHTGSLTTKEFTITITSIELAKGGRSFSYDDISIEVNKQIEGDGFLPQWTQALEYSSNVSYSIKPPLATATTGLSFNPQTGAITGTPTAAKDATTYTVTAKGSGNHTGELGAQFNITITAIDISIIDVNTNNTLSYTNITGDVGTPITEVRPTWGKKPAYHNDVSYKIVPTLDEATGLSFNTGTGAISGTPTAALPLTPYTVTATGTGNHRGMLDSTQFTIILRRDISDAPPTLSYPSITAGVGEPITDVHPVWGPELNLPSQVSYKITEGADPLPAGLSLVPATGVIRGTPTGAVAAAKDYRITVTGLEPYTGTREVTVNITITMNISSSALTLSYPPITAGGGRVVDARPHWTPTLPSSAAVRYIVTEGAAPLPTGLDLNEDTGVISGTHTETVASAEEYSITVTGSGLYTGTRYVQVSITITDTPPVDISTLTFTFTYPLATWSLGGISAAPVWGVGTPEDLTVTYRVESIPNSPAEEPIPGLPTSLKLDLNNGNITGSFARLPHITVYKVIATGTGNYAGSKEAVFLDTLVLPTAYEQTTTESTAISTRDDLERMTAGGTYHLINHIDLGPEPAADPGSTNHYWTPIPTFTGTLDGNGYAIYNLNIAGGDTDYYQGLFAAISSGATVENLGIGVTSITGNTPVGALAGQSFDNSMMNNITSAGMSETAIIKEVSGTTKSVRAVGGLVGSMNSGSTLIGNSIGISISGTVNNTGGLVGANFGTVIGYATGSVTSTANLIGGLVGANFGTVIGYATGSVTTTGTGQSGNYLGGLVGQNTGTAIGYATGSVTGSGDGNAAFAGINQSGGTLIGYATGAVSGNSNTHGFVGPHGRDSTATGYWDQESTGQDNAQSTSALGTFIGAGISATRNIVYVYPAYTDSGRQDSPAIFNADGFGDTFDLTGPDAANATWPKLKTSFTVGEQTINFPFPQPTVSDTDGQPDAEGNYTIEVVWPSQN